MIRMFTIISFLVLLASCENNSNPDYFLIQSCTVDGDDTLGIWFKADIMNRTSDTIVDHGFYWSYKSYYPGSGGDFSISLGSLENAEDFKCFIPGNQFETGSNIYMRAFIKTKMYTSYGTTVLFTYLPGEDITPRIYSITPNPCRRSDTLLITGRNFSIFSYKNIVHLDDIIIFPITECTNVYRYAPIIENTKNTIKIIMSKYSIITENDFYISVRGKESNHIKIKFVQ